ncbi:Mov34/MPN/PAD-1 family protein [Saccharothrix australiensis]|uniref:Integrative and conjugative element protein (TIGR02256 family) n=1 Tax=Saccharothrix australiensis TaxID=2072 RepID=A0A495VVT9_9PSEU|nr:Mov34/MPN/PAD-1 family protein [Saccharothrix australiensis]RKT53561.1 integrative and conjugative element protein (TIGR02256 family) [Saccharothrix australiensis]
MKPRKAQAEVHADAATTISELASAAHPRETGGLLLGWWVSGRVVIRYAIEVPDPNATTNSWSRDESSAQAALDMALAEHEHPWLGYVGDWHSHPAGHGTSGQDLTSIRRASIAYEQPLVLVVHRTDGLIEITVAHRGAHPTTRAPTAARQGQEA